MSIELRVSQYDANARINKVREVLKSLSRAELKQVTERIWVSVSGLYRFRKGEQRSLDTAAWIRLESITYANRDEKGLCSI